MDEYHYPYLVDNPVQALPWFARAFWEAAKGRVEQIKAQAYSSPDYEALPVAFLYRHAIELALKSLIWNGDEIAAQDSQRQVSGASGPDKSSHQLTVLLPFAEHVMQQFDLTWKYKTATSWEVAKTVIRYLDDADPGSYASRYPMDRRGAPSKPQDFSININGLAALLDPAIEELLDFAEELEGHRDQLCS